MPGQNTQNPPESEATGPHGHTDNDWDGKCSRCGRKMPYLEAAISVDDNTAYLCHPDDPDLPDCYSAWSQIDAERGLS